MLNCTVRLRSVLQEMSSEAAEPFRVPSGSDQESLWVQTSGAGQRQRPDSGPLGRCAVASRCCVCFHSPEDTRCGTSCHVLICHLRIVFDEVPVQVFGPFLDCLVCFLTLEYQEFFVDIGSQSFIICVFFKYFLQISDLSFYSPDTVFHRAEVLHLNEVQSINYFFHGLCLCCLYLKYHLQTQGPVDFLHSCVLFLHVRQSFYVS